MGVVEGWKKGVVDQDGRGVGFQRKIRTRYVLQDVAGS